jgi:hypothetical protein
MNTQLRVLSVVVLLLATNGVADSLPFPLQIGPETTRIVQPIMPDGTIDYGQALWQKMSAGVTDENNAGKLLRQIEACWQDYGHGVTDNDKFNQMDRDLSNAQSRPWKAEEFPDVADWLARNKTVLDLFATATQRSRLCPAPPIPGERPSLTTLPLGIVRSACNALNARALERVAARDFDGARSDIEAIRRMSTLLVNTPDLTGMLIAGALNGLIDRAELAAVQALPPEDAQRWLTRRRAEPDIRLGALAMDVGVRYNALNNVMLVLRGKGAEAIEALTFLNIGSLSTGKNAKTPFMPGDLDQVDWNLVLQRINATDDEAVRIVNEPDPVQRYQAAKKFTDRLEREHVPGNFLNDVMQPAFKGTPSRTKGQLKEDGEQLIATLRAFLQRREGETVPAFSERIAELFCHSEPVLNTVLRVDSVIQARALLHTVAMALEVYKSRVGGYPETLDLLVPAYLPRVPLDPFSGKEILYHHIADSYEVRSVGDGGLATLSVSSAQAFSTTQPGK